ncbi:Bax inhibitor-1 family protein [Arcobacter sp. YIC-80]|uniref:Bax inhibitor-1/YccA family protein n=1 Tax=Arcobacter sp. YIC-80 TaxID=3376683 RepID=UPI00384CC76B
MYRKTAKLRSENMEIDYSNILKNTYLLMSLSLLIAAIGVYIGVEFIKHFSVGDKILILGIEFGLLLGILLAKNIPIFNIILLYSFTFTTGLSFAAMLTNPFLQMGADIIIFIQFFFISSLTFIAISFYAIVTEKDFNFLGAILTSTFSIVLIAFISNMFIGSTTLALIIAVCFSILFCAAILYDTQAIIKKEIDSPVEACLILYINFIGLLSSLRFLHLVLNKDIN